MNMLISCIGKRGYLADFFRPHLGPDGRIIGTSNTRWTPGFDACDEAFVLPDIESDAYVPAVLSICEEAHVDGVISLFDPDVAVLSEHLDEFKHAGVVPVITSPQVSRMCFDKYQAYSFLKKHGFETPESYASLDEANRALNTGAATFPLFVKPRHGFGTENTFRVRNARQLEALFDYAPDMLIQQTLSGHEHNLDICLDLNGTVLNVVPERKLRRRGGETDLAEAVNHSGLAELGLRLGQTLGQCGHVGPLDVDVFVGDKGLAVLEMNPRFGGLYPTAHLAGADFTKAVVEMILGKVAEPCFGHFTPGVRMMKSFLVCGGEVPSCNCVISDRQRGTSLQSVRKSEKPGEA